MGGRRRISTRYSSSSRSTYERKRTSPSVRSYVFSSAWFSHRNHHRHRLPLRKRDRPVAGGKAFETNLTRRREIRGEAALP